MFTIVWLKSSAERKHTAHFFLSHEAKIIVHFALGKDHILKCPNYH